ncbi:inhibitor of growth protein 5-like [Babylonia areolata]|uniref:inhibitor of growth protein 5-like n=1 Tax=Babylonia areolata TaxID=304850 RepID=UPI003FCF6AB3
MAKAMYLEQYLDSLESLPSELQRNFNLIRDLDQRTQDVVQEVDRLATDYLQKVRGLSSEKRRQQLANIQQLFKKGREFGDDKVQLALQSYELVDKHIRKLDADLARFEADIKDKKPSLRDAADPVGKKKGLADKKKRKNVKETYEDEIPKKKRKKGQVQQEEPVTTVFPLSIAHPSDVLDMPVDPNEPTYCLCHQVSYGEMIGCDNPDCPIEWFHFGCVDLTTKPKGKWFCPHCQEQRKKK